MFKNKAIIVGLFSCLMLFSFIPTSEAELWELIVELYVQGDIHSGETIVVTGKVVDHAYKPISEAEIFIRAGSDTTLAFTDENGVFTGEFKDFQRIPGTYTVNVIASLDGMTGLSSTQFQVNGDVSKVSIIEEKLATDEARKYLYANESDFEKDPIGQTLFKYYQGLFEELILEEAEYRELTKEQVYLEQQRIIAENLKSQAIEEANLSSGVYEGYQYDDYIDSLDPNVRDIIASQLNFTKNTFEDAQNLRDEIIANGGTYEEARQAYLDMISIPKEFLEQFNQELLDEELEENSKNQ
ncbi:MAG: carboxypeptidase regulatory-like domain-containing protein [Nitrosopumilus sp.]|nr:carboxypeptidase regulatory-like domain-containing protein [Nitrosopumilus sp.]